MIDARFPGRRHRLHKLGRHRQFLGRNAVFAGFAARQLVFGRVHEFLRVSHQQEDQRVTQRHHRGQVFPGPDHHPRHPDLLRLAKCFAQQHVTLLRLLAGHQHVGLLEEADVDRVFVDERLDLHRLVRFRRGGGDVLFLDHHIATLVVLEGLDDLFPGHFLTGVGIDPLEPDRLAIPPIEHAEGKIRASRARHQRYGHIEQAERKVTGPDGAGHVEASRGRHSSLRRAMSRSCRRVQLHDEDRAVAWHARTIAVRFRCDAEPALPSIVVETHGVACVERQQRRRLVDREGLLSSRQT